MIGAGLYYSATSAFAAIGDFGGTTELDTVLPDEGTDIRQTIVKVLNAVLNFLALIAVIFIIIGGIRLIVSQGDDEAKDKAKKTILYAIVGLIIVLIARILVGLVTVYLAGQLS